MYWNGINAQFSVCPAFSILKINYIRFTLIKVCRCTIFELPKGWGQGTNYFHHMTFLPDHRNSHDISFNYRTYCISSTCISIAYGVDSSRDLMTCTFPWKDNSFERQFCSCALTLCKWDSQLELISTFLPNSTPNTFLGPIKNSMLPNFPIFSSFTTFLLFCSYEVCKKMFVSFTYWHNYISRSIPQLMIFIPFISLLFLIIHGRGSAWIITCYL